MIDHYNVQLFFPKSWASIQKDPHQKQAKQILRQQIRAALKKSKTLDEFFDTLLEDYGVAVKESRGRFSYLTPDRTKPITSRKLGDDFSKEAILAALENHAKQIIPCFTRRRINI